MIVIKSYRPRIQATISQKAYDLLIDALIDSESKLYNRVMSRAIDTIILDYFDFPKIKKSHQELYGKQRAVIQELKDEINQLKDD